MANCERFIPQEYNRAKYIKKKKKHQKNKCLITEKEHRRLPSS